MKPNEHQSAKQKNVPLTIPRGDAGDLRPFRAPAPGMREIRYRRKRLFPNVLLRVSAVNASSATIKI
jgi:hypothetical protein